MRERSSRWFRPRDSEVDAHPLADRLERAIADDDVIDNGNANEISDLAEAARERDVFGGRARVAGGVVVGDDTAGGGHTKERAEDLARVDLDGGDGAAGDLDDIEEAVADVDANREEDF